MPVIHNRKSMKYKTDYEIDFKILILSAVDDEELDPGLKLAIEALESFWIPFEVKVLTKNGARDQEVKLELFNDDGSGKYSGIITTEFNLSYRSRKSQAYESALSSYEWEKLFNYAKNFDVRHVSLFTYPQSYIGVEEIHGVDKGRPNTILLDKNNISQYTSGINTQAQINFKDVWHYPVRVLESHEATTKPISYFLNNENSVSAVIHKTNDQREQLHFFFSQSKDLFLSKFMSSIWVKWLVKNFYVGKRRTYLTAQIDDVFIPTELWNPASQTGEKELYRNSVQDIQHYLNFQSQYLKPKTNDYHFKIEMAFNGKGILEYGGLTIDPLTIFLRDHASSFNWVSHTYNHFELDHLSYDEVVDEVINNNKAAFAFLGENIRLYSTKGLVTPRISGLFNPQALQAFSDLNYNYVVGDNTVQNLSPNINKHIPRKTTYEMNGFQGLSIIPRFPNDIFYNVSKPWELQTLFNHLYQYRGQDRFGIEEILDKNASELTSSLLSFDYSMHMFHQANMRVFDYHGAQESLLSLWFKRGIENFRRYSTLPLKSLSFDEVIQVYNERENYEKCGLKTKLKYRGRKLQELKMTSMGECLVPVTGLSYYRLLTPELRRSEVFGPDNTIYIQSNPDHEISVYLN